MHEILIFFFPFFISLLCLFQEKKKKKEIRKVKNTKEKDSLLQYFVKITIER